MKVSIRHKPIDMSKSSNKTCICIPGDLHKHVCILAKESGCTKTEILRAALQEWIKYKRNVAVDHEILRAALQEWIKYKRT